MPRKDDDFDFKIFVDPSCLSDPMDGETTTTPATQLPAEAAPEIADIPVAAEPTEQAPSSDVHSNDDLCDDENAGPEPQIPDTAEELHKEQPDQEPIEELHDQTDLDNDIPELDAAEQHDSSALEEESLLEGDSTVEEHTTDEHFDIDKNEYAIADESVVETEHSITEEHHDEEAPDANNHHDEEDNDEPLVEESQDTGDDSYIGEDAETPKALRSGTGDDAELKPAASTSTDRKASLRTEALIQAAARAVVAKLEKRSSNRDSTSQVDEEADTSLLSTDSQNHHDGMEASYEESPSQSRRESAASQIHHEIPSRSVSGDEGGDSSSHHEAEDDVFSDRSARSSIGSFDGHSDGAAKSQAHDDEPQNQSFLSHGRSPRISGVSIISGLSQYDKEDFVPASRETRLPFRTPSDIRAMQMSSPTPSVFNGASPRSGKRHTGHSINSIPRSSHFQSPTASAQYSPKGRSTPTRLKPRKVTAPLVLLHVTLLPLRWMWGDVLDGLDPVDGKALDENKEMYRASDQLKTLRDAWRELQDCVGETVLQRGVLIPHPQDDFEVLEERLLEALELPLRRRARILECGHYLGPSNMSDFDDEESDDGYTSESTRTKEDKRHWCKTCKSDIKYEALGPGKVFRVKVYASNGLMRAGAWEACWKDMERVDVEVEPVVEPAMQAELERLAEIQNRLEDERQREEEERQREADAAAEEELRREESERELGKHEFEEEAVADQTPPVTSEAERTWEAERTGTDRHSREVVMSSPPPSSMQVAMHASPPQPPYSSALRADSPALMGVTHSSRSMRSEPVDTSEERMRRDEERMREIYGDVPTPQPYSEMGSSVRGEHGFTRPRHPDSYVPPPSPRSPSEEAYERRQQRGQRSNLENASFIDLLLEAFKVLLRDPKNVAIIVLCVFLTCVIVRPTPQAPVFPEGQLTYRQEAKQDVVMHTPAVKMETQARPQVDGPAASLSPEAALGTTLVESVSNIIMETSAASAAMEMAMPSNLLEAPPSIEELAVPELTLEVLEAPSVSEESTVPEVALKELEVPSPIEEPTMPELALKDIPSELPETALDSLPSEIDTSAPLEIEAPVAILEESVVFDTPVEEDSAVIPETDVESPVAPLDVLSEEVAAETISVEASDVPPGDDAAIAVDDVAANLELGVEQEIEVVDEVESEVAAVPEVAELVEDQAVVELAGDQAPVVVEVVNTVEEAPLSGETIVGAEATIDNGIPLDAEASDLPIDNDVTVSTETSELLIDNEILGEAETLLDAEAIVSSAVDDSTAATAAEEIVPSSAAVDDNTATTVKDVLPEATHPCESYVCSYMAGDAAPTPRVFPVTQRTTIKVFETITETVRVSVTATETVSFVETAVPQTVEETVYETETLRVTVSIPVDSTTARDEL
ncbi:hypothetical protein B0T16DRAFT_422461 [Cercophora newfieldiana]|uniref:Pathway-specific nitrogen regulator n=1 Tax=Cercophora newfieldiana TaxID=92897 RepID=A0AA39XU25_9PEZI|nr:hypothetical protein B0T16DRAFT_422461 [Cercophora newfieldiana]